MERSWTPRAGARAEPVGEGASALAISQLAVPYGRLAAVLDVTFEVAEGDSALTLHESNYPPVEYLPLQDVDADVIIPTDHETYCPYKGDASYYSLSTADGELENVIWTYEQPYDAVAEIKDHVAFYPNKV